MPMDGNHRTRFQGIKHTVTQILHTRMEIEIHTQARQLLSLLRYTVHQIFVNYFHIANMLGKHKIIIHIGLQPVTALIKNKSTTQLSAFSPCTSSVNSQRKAFTAFLKCPVNIARIPLNPCIGTEKSVVPA
jgi:hypothetical protein